MSEEELIEKPVDELAKEKEAEEKEANSVKRESGDPLGFLIIPVFGVILVAVILLWVNQKEEDNGPRFYPVTGQVTLNKKPLKGNFRIYFYPNDGSDNPFSSALLNVEDGTYELLGNRRNIKGAMPGEYRVVIKMMEGKDEAWRIKASLKAARDGTMKFDPKDGGSVVPDDPDPPFDKAFSDAFKTPQRAIVTESTNVINIDLPLPPKVPVLSAQKQKGKGKKRGGEQPKTKNQGKQNAAKESESNKASSKSLNTPKS